MQSLHGSTGSPAPLFVSLSTASAIDPDLGLRVAFLQHIPLLEAESLHRREYILCDVHHVDNLTQGGTFSRDRWDV